MAAKLSHDDLRLAAHTIRGLAMDGVQKAKSGHPGMPLGMADVAAVLWFHHLKDSPARPDWGDRDRFVLSAGHGSMLLYSLLHLSGYPLPMEQLKQFRQWGSQTPGHPEHGHGDGVETTTGPLGQGCGNAVGMALAERMLAARFNTDAAQPVDHHTYVLCGDGDLMEGVSHEAFSLAGHLGLHKLIALYDSNRITIEGSTDLAYSDNVKRRFQGYNWNVLEVDGHDYAQIDKAIRRAKREQTRPTMIICKTHIAWGSPNKVDTSGAHGEPLGDDEVAATKRVLGLPADQTFYVSDKVRDLFAARAKRGNRRAAQWDRAFATYAAANPDKAAAWAQAFSGALPENLDSQMPCFDPATPVATRNASGTVIQALAKAIPNFVGGSADLAPSTKTLINKVESVGPHRYDGRNLHFGIREHGMGAILNGMALHGGFRVFGATFFVFADYFRPAIRLAAIMKLPIVYVLTHDSFYVGEDGPTHEPIEHLASLRCIPNLTILRPADATETTAAWLTALRHTTGPTALLLTRQNLATIDRRTHPAAEELAKGAYTLWQSAPGTPDLILMASGSEVELVLQAGHKLAGEKIVRVVSFPSWELFEKQPQSYRDAVLPPACTRRLAVEAGSPMGWERYIGTAGHMLGMSRFGASAPYKVLGEKFGYTVENVLALARKL
ncbi:MAG: transketolase [Lentisphaerae bacterium]|nr:transketolase [Lentisphaerota bacterium]